MKKKRYNALIIVATIMMIIYFGWRLFFTFPTTYGTVPMIAACILFLCEFVSAVEAFIHLITSMNPLIPEKPEIPEEWYPEVDVFIATHNESTDILYKTVNGCKYMKYPDKSKVHIWICDDGNRVEMKELAEQMGIGWIGLANNKLAKAGNLNNALSKTSAPLVVTFDADMIPTRNFLLETVPYFFLPKMKKLEDGTWVERDENEIDKDYKIGFIQTPQSFYNPDLFQYNLYATDKVPNEQDYFFREINVSRNKTNSPIYAGSNTVISRQALEEVGGIATGTITEDFETGIHIQGRGYTCYAISEVVAHGLAPDTVDSLIKQRERWGRGCIYSLRKMHIWKNKEMTFKSKISYFSCKLYWWTFFRRFIFILCPILFAVFSVPVMECKPWELLVFWLPSYYLFNLAQKVESGNIRTITWSNIIDTVLFPYLVIPIFLEAIGIKKHQFVVTRKDRVIEDSDDKALAIPHAVLLLFSFFALITSLHDLLAYKAVGSIIIIYWLFVNSYALLMAIFFMLGRRNLRMSERYKVQLPVKVIFDGHTFYGSTVDISETGMAVKFVDNVVYTPKGSVRLHIKTHHYNAHMDARQVYVSTEIDPETNKKIYRYSFQITNISEKDKAEYYQIIFDRAPSLPEFTEKSDSAFASISDNLSERINGVTNAKRRLLRINVNEIVQTVDRKDIYMYDYSYQYTVLRRKDTDDAEKVWLEPVSGLQMECSLERVIDEERALYRIINGKESLFDERFSNTLNRWIEQDTSL